MRPYVDAVRRGEPVSFDTSVRTPSGAQREPEGVLTPDCDGDGGTLGFDAVIVEVTETRAADSSRRVAR